MEGTEQEKTPEVGNQEPEIGNQEVGPSSPIPGPSVASDLGLGVGGMPVGEVQYPTPTSPTPTPEIGPEFGSGMDSPSSDHEGTEPSGGVLAELVFEGDLEVVQVLPQYVRLKVIRAPGANPFLVEENLTFSRDLLPKGYAFEEGRRYKLGIVRVK